MPQNVRYDKLQLELQIALNSVLAARVSMLTGADQGILRATVSGLLIGLETQILAIKTAISEISESVHSEPTMAPPAPEQEAFQA